MKHLSAIKSTAFFLPLLMLFLFSGMRSRAQTGDTWLYVYGDRDRDEVNGPSITGNQVAVEALFNHTQSFDPIEQRGDLVSRHSNDIPCDSYLQVWDDLSGVSIGDLDISGNKLTVEAVFNTDTYDTTYMGGDIISKHCDPSTVNYLVRPNQIAITTFNGSVTNFYHIEAPCNAVPGITYYIALVYDGQNLKFYRNWELLGQIPASGNLITNSWPTMIGAGAACGITAPESFHGYINEVRIWNIARSQNDLLTYYRTTLPNPTSTPGLQAYYTFNSLVNQQGNTAWDGTIFGNATINAIAPYCLPDSTYNYVCYAYRKDLSTSSISSQNVPEPHSLTGSLLLYPNPAKETVKLEYDATNSTTITIKVVDVTGKTVMVLNKSVISGKNTITATTSSLNNGFYLVQFIDGNKVQTKKLIINK